MTATVTQYRRGRNYTRVGDLVKCVPTTRERSFIGRVTRIDVSDEGEVIAVNVSTVCTCGGRKHPDAGKARAFHPDRITRTRVIPLADQPEED